MAYKTNFLPGSIVLASEINSNFTILRDNLEVSEDLTSQILGANSLFTTANDIQASTQSLVQIFRNGLRLRTCTTPGDGGDYFISGSNAFDLYDSGGGLSVPTIGETLTIVYRKVV